MKGLYAIYRKEMGHYFVSPVAYIIVGVFLILSGLLLQSPAGRADSASHAGGAASRADGRRGAI